MECYHKPRLCPPPRIASNIDASSLLRPRYLVKFKQCQLRCPIEMGCGPSLGEIRGLWSWSGIPEKCGFFQSKQESGTHGKHEKGRGHQGGGETPLVSRGL